MSYVQYMDTFHLSMALGELRRVMNRTIRVLVGVVLWICVASASVAAREPGAGAVLYTTIQGTEYMLLADHKNNRRGWASMGGRLDGDAPIDAAAREIEEETNGVLQRDWVRTQLETARSHREEDGNWHYTTYFLKIPYTPAVTFEVTAPPNTLKGTDERGPYTWLPVGEVLKALAKYARDKDGIAFPQQYLPVNHQSDKYWDRFIESLARVKEARGLPWN